MAWTEISGSGQKNYVKTEGFTYNSFARTREKAICAKIVRKYTTVGRDSTLRAICLHNGIFKDDYPAHTEGGHLIALTNGGADNAYNLVPMYAGFNRETWREIERGIKSDTAKNVMITITYSTSDKRMPKTFKTYVDYGGDADPDKLGQWTLYSTLSMDTPPAPLVITLSKKAEKAIQYMIDFADDNKLDASDAGLDTKYIAPTNDRVYEFLDVARAYEKPFAKYKILANEIGANMGMDGTVGRGWAFSEHQRSIILAVNAYLNGGTVKSDSDNTIVLVGSSTHAPHIDHVVPMTRGTGYNAYSNAHVLTEQQNKAKNG